MTRDRRQVVVIGGGVIGCAILWELARRRIEAVLIEAEPDLCEGTSKSNSGIIHTGFDSKVGTLESRMLRRAAELWPRTLEDLGVPFLAVGALMLARSEDEAIRLAADVTRNATALGVHTEVLTGPDLRDVAPYLADDVVAALSVPDEGVVDPFWLTRAYAEAAMAGGADVLFGRAVTALEVGPDQVALTLDDGVSLIADQVIDAAGLKADDVARLAGDRSFRLTPRKGQFLVSEETFGVDRIILPIPGPMGKGMLVTPIVFGGLLLGPTAVDGTDKDDRAADPAERDHIIASCATLVPAVAESIPIRQFAGLRHVSSTGDFIVQPSVVGDRLYLAAGIRSTGISTSPAIAEAVVLDVAKRRGWPRGGARALAPPPIELSEDAGEVVCICRSISRSEIVAASRRPTLPMTLDAVKRRSGATFGDCQGNLCALEVASILAGERAIPLEAIEKHRRGSWLWQASPGPGSLGHAVPQLPAPRSPQLRSRDTAADPTPDIIIIGAGTAGMAAASAAAASGLVVLVIDRSSDRAHAAQESADRIRGQVATVTGLRARGEGWFVLAQTPTGSLELDSQAVVAATGAYFEPREHRRIAGPRSAGIMTADLAWRLLEAGMRPGEEVALVGAGRRADQLAQRLERFGARVTPLDGIPEAIRGALRLTGVRLDGRWIDVDSLVLADRLVPQTFLLRGLGLVDDRPGTPAPVTGDGRLPFSGLWAAGCCVRPSLDHDGCADGGAVVGRSVARAIVALGAGS